MDVTILHATEGTGIEFNSPGQSRFQNADLSARLHQECVAALALANVPENRIIDFSLPQYALPKRLTYVTRRITSFLQESQADIVLTHPYEGGHPDHDAIAFATHAALRILNESGVKPPAVFEMALYPSGKPTAKVPEFLSRMDSESTTLLLDERSQKLKKRMYACLTTQQDLAMASPANFERFRRPPDYDFTRPPQGGKLHYERFDWAMSPDEWQALSTRAFSQLFPGSKRREFISNQTAA
jgi:LmbE family N-acetylglucosaminyl deacetylase